MAGVSAPDLGLLPHRRRAVARMHGGLYSFYSVFRRPLALLTGGKCVFALWSARLQDAGNTASHEWFKQRICGTPEVR